MNLLAAMRYLVALDKHRHFGRAAQACHITQPALSNALRALEDEFGVAIITRSRTYGGLTQEGEAVLDTARRMLRDVDLLTQELQSTAESPRGALRMAAVPTAMPLLTVFATTLRRLHPGLVPTVLAMSSPDIEAQLEDLSLDLALGYTERLGKEGGRFRSWPQVHERYYFLRRQSGKGGMTLHYGSPMTWSEAATFPLCQLTPDMHNRTIIDAALASIGMSSAPAIETNSLLAVTLAVSVGDVCAILPGAIVAAVRGQADLEALPLVEPDVRTPLGFIARTDDRPSRAVQAALRLMAAPEWGETLERHAGEGGGLSGPAPF
jgi:DNA-binding transcriptional LysR family regulator